jgi:hypothetical protein
LSISRVTAACLASLALGAPAIAAPPAPSPVGAWEFKTGDIAGCTISGKMTVLKPTETGGPYPCRFESVQACTQAKPPAAYKVAQSCTVNVSGSQVVIKSKIQKIISVTPDWAMPQVARNYAPDDFTVDINATASQMTGTFYSHGQAKVTFWRPSNGLTS